MDTTEEYAWVQSSQREVLFSSAIKSKSLKFSGGVNMIE